MKIKEFFDIARNKIFAHSDDLLLDDRTAENIVAKISTKTMNELLSNVMDILSLIWAAYNGQKLCFSLANGDDYKELTKSLCTLYGDVKFI